MPTQKFLVIIATLLAIGTIWLSLPTDQRPTANAIREENGTQIIHIIAQGGYSPNRINAKANLPTKLEIETKGTYDCSSALTIPSLNYQKQLEPNDVTVLELPNQEQGKKLTGLCSMGMYNFEINFT